MKQQNSMEYDEFLMRLQLGRMIVEYCGEYMHDERMNDTAYRLKRRDELVSKIVNCVRSVKPPPAADRPHKDELSLEIFLFKLLARFLRWMEKRHE